MRTPFVYPWSLTALLLAVGLASAACSGDDGESKPSGNDDAGVGGTAGSGLGGTGGTDVGGTGGGGAGGEAGTGATGGSEQDAAPDAELESCDGEGFLADYTSGQMYVRDDGDIWTYVGVTEDTPPYEVLQAEVWESYGAPTTPGTYTLGAEETSYETCGVCLLMQTECTDNGCSKILMPKEGGTYTLTTLGEGAGKTFEMTLDDVTFQEVTLEDDSPVTTPVADGSTWCLSDVTISTTLVGPHVDMPQPTGLSCDYPAPPYDFLGPEDGETEPAPGTIPPMAWPGAYLDGQEVGLDLAQYKCDNPNIKTLFIVAGGGWCPACASFMQQDVCPDGGLEDQLHALNAELLYVWGDAAQPGTPATNAYADTKVSSYGCDGGYRISDTDNAAGARVIFGSPMHTAIPWVAAVRMEDMKLTHEQSEESQYWMDFTGIAEQNNQ